MATTRSAPSGTATDRGVHRRDRWGNLLCWSIAFANGLLVLYLVGGIATGFLRASHILHWPFAVGIPVALVFLFLVPLLGLAGQVLTLGSPALPPRIAGGAGLAVSVVLWLLLLIAPAPGI